MKKHRLLKNILYPILIVFIGSLVIIFTFSCRNMFNGSIDLNNVYGSMFYNKDNSISLRILEKYIDIFIGDEAYEWSYTAEDNFIHMTNDNGESKDCFFLISEDVIFDYSVREYYYRGLYE